MNTWFRFYNDAINDPKILRLSDSLYRSWTGLLCIASKNNGLIPAIDDVAIMLRVDVSSAEKIIAELIERELIDRVRGGGLSPHNWRKRQYKSDVSTDRVKQFRKRKGNVAVTPPETEQIQTTETEKKDIRTVAIATRPAAAEPFEEFWKAYPRRDGANPKSPAKKLFVAAVKGGADPAAIIEGARRCAAAEHEKIGTPYIPQAVKWLRDRRWEDYAAGPPSAGLSDDERKRKFEELRNGGSDSDGKNLQRIGAGPRALDGPRREEPTKPTDDKARHAGMVRLGGLFQAPSGFRAIRDDASEGGAEPGNDSTGQLARPV